MSNTVNITVDNQAQAAYIKFTNNTITKTVVVTDDLNVDLDAEGTIVGLEILSLTKDVNQAMLDLLFSREPNISAKIIG